MNLSPNNKNIYSNGSITCANKESKYSKQCWNCSTFKKSV